MVSITSKNAYIKADLSYFADVDLDITDRIIYVMKDNAVTVSLSKNMEKVIVSLSNNEELILDMQGENGLPAKVSGRTPISNAELAEMLAELKNL